MNYKINRVSAENETGNFKFDMTQIPNEAWKELGEWLVGEYEQGVMFSKPENITDIKMLVKFRRPTKDESGLCLISSMKLQFIDENDQLIELNYNFDLFGETFLGESSPISAMYLTAIAPHVAGLGGYIESTL